jgi:hypothetical protein
MTSLHQQGHQRLADYARSTGHENDGHAQQSITAARADKKAETSPRDLVAAAYAANECDRIVL